MSDLLDRLGRALEGRYRVEREIGRGGMAVVCLAEDLKHRRSVAIKVMKPEISRDVGSERFLREIEIAARLTHPNILPLHDSGEADGLLYFVMPYIEGDTLRDRLDREGRLPLDEAIRIAGEVGDALDYAHGLGLVHRDVKPENILFQAGHAVVSDFGIAKAMTEAGASALTQTGVAIGTLRYMSPEQASGDAEVDTRSDVYSLGCVLYEMLSGGAPFAGVSDRALLARKVTEPAPELEGAGADVPATVREVARRALEREPGDRYASPGALARALREAVTVEAVAAHARRTSRARTLRAVAAAALVLLLGAGGWWATSLVGEPGIELVAVLPLRNATNDPDQDFFVSGLHTELIQELSRADVRVISPTSVMQYRENQRPASEVARELGVDAIIEGSTSLVGDNVSLDLRLTDGATDELIWFESFESGLGDVLGLYADATRAIATRIGVRLTPEVDAALASAPEVSPEVYRALLQARFHRSQISEAGMTNALDYYEFVLERDPDNAEALAGIAGVWGARAQNGYVSAQEAQERGE
ncbi:MAG TPA: serine/threonine-protein kinase, partial [Longimicrobiales bacterium]|nr:serine/threonine-protein kinase [Longimicrobiales bacterium]